MPKIRLAGRRLSPGAAWRIQWSRRPRELRHEGREAEPRSEQRYPRYRALTGPDDDAFCQRVSEALDLGYELYGSPAATYDGQRVILCQALIWPSEHR